MQEKPSGTQPTVAVVGPRADSHGGVAATVRLLLGSDLAERYTLVSVSTYCDGSPAAKAAQAARGLGSLAWLCARRRVDLVHLHTSSGSSLARKSLGLAIARAARVPTIVHVHGGGFHSDRRRPGLSGAAERRVVRWTLEGADAVVTLTTGWERQLSIRGRVRRSRVIPNVPDVTATVSRNGAPANDAPTVVFLGHLIRNKGVYELLDALLAVREDHPGVQLVMAGEGPEADGLRRRIHESGLDRRAVELPGWLGPDEKARLLARAACFVLPSYVEGLPLTVLEAMVVGVPIIATAVGGVPEIVRDGKEALVVPPRDSAALARAIARVLDDPSFATSLADEARRRVLAEFTSDQFVGRVDSLYQEVLNDR